KYLRVGWQRRVARGGRALDRSVPAVHQLSCLVGPRRRRASISEPGRERLEPGLGVADQRQRALLSGVEPRGLELGPSRSGAAGLRNRLREAVVKSERRVPTARMASASAAIAFAAEAPVTPIAPTAAG